jgi:membrane-associated phospholipid phosphatase
MKKTCIFFLLFFSLLRAGFSDVTFRVSPYDLSFSREAFLLGSGVLMLGTGLLLNNVIPQDRASDAQLDFHDINGFDRWAAMAYNEDADLASDIVIAGLSALPALLFIDRSGNEILKITIMYAEAMALTHGLKDIVYSCISRYRPYAYFDDPSEDYDSIYSANSFYSGHTASAFTSAAFLTTVFNSYHGNSLWTYAVGGGAFTLATSVAVLRVVSGNHFISDVLVGAACGSFIGFIVPYIHKPHNDTNPQISFSTDGESSFGISSTFHY